MWHEKAYMKNKVLVYTDENMLIVYYVLYKKYRYLT